MSATNVIRTLGRGAQAAEAVDDGTETGSGGAALLVRLGGQGLQAPQAPERGRGDDGVRRCTPTPYPPQSTRSAGDNGPTIIAADIANTPRALAAGSCSRGRIRG